MALGKAGCHVSLPRCSKLGKCRIPGHYIRHPRGRWEGHFGVAPPPACTGRRCSRCTVQPCERGLPAGALHRRRLALGGGAPGAAAQPCERGLPAGGQGGLTGGCWEGHFGVAPPPACTGRRCSRCSGATLRARTASRWAGRADRGLLEGTFWRCTAAGLHWAAVLPGQRCNPASEDCQQVGRAG